jgi:hypothetical protein
LAQLPLRKQARLPALALIQPRPCTALNGAFYRLHVDWLCPPANADETILAGDGYVSMFRLKDKFE